jgi:putative acetyltransferase
MPIVREMRPEDARTFLEVNRAAVRGSAGRNYPTAVIEAWAALSITDKLVEGPEERSFETEHR